APRLEARRDPRRDLGRGADVYPPGRPFEAGVRYTFEIAPSLNAVLRTGKLPGTTVIDLLAERRAVWATGWGGVVRFSRTGRVLLRQPFYGSGWGQAFFFSGGEKRIIL